MPESKDQTNKIRYVYPALLFIFFVLWLMSCRDFLSGSISITADTLPNYCILKYYFNCLLNGIWPFWDPYIFLGRPFLYIASSGALNPFAYIMPILTLLGLDYYQAYVVFLAAYYFFGVLGFYVLAKNIFKEESWALIAAVALMFSGIGAMLFNQIFIPYLFVPCVWFFVFFLRFAAGFRLSDFLAMVFFLMLIVISYLPFYFLTLFLIFTVLVGVLYTQHSVDFLRGLGGFVSRHKMICFVAICAMGLVMIPLLVFKAENARGEFISPARHQITAVGEKKRSDAQMDFTDVAFAGTLGERVKGGRLFSHLDNFNYFSDDFFYIPIVIWLALGIAVITPFGRRQCLLLGLTLSIFFVSLGAGTPFYEVLFNHIFYFKFFRNLFFYMAFLIPLIILFGVSQLKVLVEQSNFFEPRKQWMSLLTISVLHAGFIVLLQYQDNILVSSYLTVLMSWILFALLCLGKVKRKSLAFLLAVLLLMIIEPVEVFMHRAFNASEFACRLPSERRHHEFSYTRPSKEGPPLPCLFSPETSFYKYFPIMSDFKDTTGVIVEASDLVSPTVNEFFHKIYKDDLLRVIGNKFWLYDRVQEWNGIDELRTSLKKKENSVYVQGADDARLESLRNADPAKIAEQPLALQNDRPDFSVVQFNANSLKFKTNFPVSKFLVYTQAYGADWKVLVDGRAGPLYKAQGAFQGLLIPAGPHVVQLRYQPWGGIWPYVIPLAALFGMLGWWGWTALRQKETAGAARLETVQSEARPFSAVKQSLTFYVLTATAIVGLVDFSFVHYWRLNDDLKIIYIVGHARPLDCILYFDYRAHLDPNDAEAYAGLAKNYYILGKPKEALKAYTMAVSLNPQKYGQDKLLQLIHQRILADLSK
jgi:hypothetical protein